MAEERHVPPEPDESRKAERDARHRTYARFGSIEDRVTGLTGVVVDHADTAARFWLISAAFWFVIITFWGLIAATQLSTPEFWNAHGWLTFGRIRPMHQENAIYTWLSMAWWGAFFYMAPRLLGTRSMWSEGLGIFTGIFYNAATLAGTIGIAFGNTQGREWAEYPWIIDICVLIVFFLNWLNLLLTVNIRKVKPLFVSLWWMLASPIWVMGAIIYGNVVWNVGNPWGHPSGYLPSGLHDAIINWHGNHNLFGLWITPGGIALIYYFVARITRNPIYSNTLGLISFWLFVLTYASVGSHHLLQAPVPDWLKTLGIFNSIGIIIPVMAFFTVIFLSMRGSWEWYWTNLPLRFVLTGFVFYILVNIQGAMQSVQPVNMIIHFTYWVIGHTHLAFLGGFTPIAMAALYHMIPTSRGKPSYSRTLGEWSFWLWAVGFLIYFWAMAIAGFEQGQSWLNGMPEVWVLPRLHIWNLFRAVAGGMIHAAAWITLILALVNYFGNTRPIVARRMEVDTRSSQLETSR